MSDHPEWVGASAATRLCGCGTTTLACAATDGRVVWRQRQIGQRVQREYYVPSLRRLAIAYGGPLKASA